VLVSSHPKARHWAPKVERRLREELGKLDLTINEEKSRIVDFGAGEPFDYLGYTFRLVDGERPPKMKMVLARPRKKKRTEFLRALGDTMRKYLHRPVGEVVRRIVNPRVRGWVNYFGWGNASCDLDFVAWQVEQKVRRCTNRLRRG
jgi:RNA-directed DNA polymerase